MGAHAARKASEVIENAETIIGIELLAGAQAIDLRRDLAPGKGTAAAHNAIRDAIPTMQKDRLLGADILKIRELGQNKVIADAVEDAVGSI